MDVEHVGRCNIHPCGECSDTKLIIPNMTLVNLGFWPGFEGSVGGRCALLRVCSGRHWRNDSRS